MSILVACVLVLFLRLGAEAVVPFVLSVLLFYALDPAVDALQRWRVPRAIGAALALGVVLTGVAAASCQMACVDSAQPFKQTANPQRWIR